MNREPIEFARDQLLELARDEELVRQFSLEFWATSTAVHALEVEEDPDCGFAGCFIGWAIHQQWFARFGLRMAFEAWTPDGLSISSKNIYPRVVSGGDPAFDAFTTGDQKYAGKATDAIAWLFGVKPITMGHIIYEESYEQNYDDSLPATGPAEVAARLQKLLDFGDDTLFRQWMENELLEWQADRDEREEPQMSVREEEEVS